MIALIQIGDDIPQDLAISKSERDKLLFASLPKSSTLHLQVVGMTAQDGLGYVIAYTARDGAIVRLAEPVGPIAFKRASVAGWRN